MQTLGLSVEVCTFSWGKMTLLGKREMEVLQEPCVGVIQGSLGRATGPVSSLTRVASGQTLCQALGIKPQTRQVSSETSIHEVPSAVWGEGRDLGWRSRGRLRSLSTLTKPLWGGPGPCQPHSAPLQGGLYPGTAALRTVHAALRPSQHRGPCKIRKDVW